MKVQGIKDDIEGIIFDMDGLLVNSEYLYWQANIQAAKEDGLAIPEDSYLKLVGASVSAMEKFYHQYFKSKSQRDDFIKRTDDLVEKWTDEGKLKLRPGVQDALNKFKQANVKLAIASSNYERVIEHNLQVTKTRSYFEFHLSYDDVKRQHVKAKPAPDIYLLAQEKISIPKNNILVFEDSSTGVAAAKSAGLKCVMIPDLKPATELDKKNATMILKNFFEFLKIIS
ncbi:HAD superfamily hydrolase (TIGR01509 family) [Lactobacillus colini]|uniref:HAD superfamily hydrolase (TIGR01509 family) n=1 Tax=Lactobacillus colini TaxID=1819254 RepID=A0ABS4MDQ8_9LACO|nr:HAD family phosphatase [Lactobacillus colini]MBP2057819.1 HAD superfamily hydrolase (TIGR01509 family) [Lactobacillus colini]